MDRRLFLATLGGGLAAGAGPSRSAPRASPPLINSYVTSIGQTGTGAVPRSGERLLLSRDGARAYDSRSVLVSTMSGDPLGYLPATHAETIEPLLAAGFEAEAWVESSRTHPRPAVRIAIAFHPAEAA